jgi:hypothetical protein
MFETTLGSPDANAVSVRRALGQCLLALLLSGCATNTGVLTTGPGTYSISVEREAMLGGRSAARRIAFTEAADYCRAKSLQLKVLETRAFGSSIVPETGIDISFTCVPAGAELVPQAF